MLLTVVAFFPNAGDEVSSYSFETMLIRVVSSFHFFPPPLRCVISSIIIFSFSLRDA